MDALRSRTQATERFEDESPFRIGGAAIDPSSRDVTINGKSERIQPQPLRVLMLLRRHKGRVVTRDEIVEQCWDRRIVGDDVINRAILILRRLATRAGGFRIETIPRAGYRLVEDGSIARPSAAWQLPAITVGLALLLAVAVVVLQRSSAPSEPTLTVSVLPFAAAGSADAAQLGRRARSDVAAALTESGFAVVPAGKGDLTISGDLAAAAGKSRIDVVVGFGPERRPMMSRTFERPDADAEALPLQVAADIAETLSVTARFLTFDGDVADPALASQMFAFIQAGRDGDGLRQHQIAYRMFAAHSDSAAAELMLAGTYAGTLQAFTVPERKARVRIARNILGRRKGHARSGEFGPTWCMLHPRPWFADCELRLRESAKGVRTGSAAPQRLAELVADVGRTDEALQLARVAYSKDRYYSNNAGVLIQLLEIVGRHREAEAVYAASIRQWPDSWTLRWNRIMGLSARRDFAALERFASTISRSEFKFDAETMQSILTAYREGDREEMIRQCTRENLRWSTQNTCVAALAAVGELDTSFAIAFELFPKQAGRSRAEDEAIWLERPEYFTLTLLSGPAGAPLRRDPRFVQLAAQTGLLRYWRAGRPPDFCLGRHPEPVCRELGSRIHA